MFWYVGLIPDLATFRDRSKTRISKIIYGILAMGWRGSAIHWHRYRTAYLLLAGIATPLVVSVHTVVSSRLRGGGGSRLAHDDLPPYFVAGAIYSGFAMVLTLAIPLRRYYGLEDFITTKHLENMAKILLVTGLIVSYGYALEAFFAWYSGNTFEQFMMKNRATGPYWHTYFLLILCNCLSVQVLWSKWARTCVPLLWVLSIVINIGMWLERYVIVVTSLARDYIPERGGCITGRSGTTRCITARSGSSSPSSSCSFGSCL